MTFAKSRTNTRIGGSSQVISDVQCLRAFVLVMYVSVMESQKLVNFVDCMVLNLKMLPEKSRLSWNVQYCIIFVISLQFQDRLEFKVRILEITPL